MRAHNNFKKGAVDMLLLHILHSKGDCYRSIFITYKRLSHWYVGKTKTTISYIFFLYLISISLFMTFFLCFPGYLPCLASRSYWCSLSSTLFLNWINSMLSRKNGSYVLWEPQLAAILLSKTTNRISILSVVFSYIRYYLMKALSTFP